MKTHYLAGCSALAISLSLASQASAAPVVISAPTNTGVVMNSSPSDTFTNNSTITGPSVAVQINGDITDVTNGVDGVVSGGSAADEGNGFSIEGAVSGTFLNRGKVTTIDGPGVFILGDVGRFENTGTIAARGGEPDPGNPANPGNAVSFKGNVTEFVNSGTLSAEWNGVAFDGGVASFRNESSGVIEAEKRGAIFAPLGMTSFFNAGRITTLSGAPPYVAAIDAGPSFGSFINTGIIEALSAQSAGVGMRNGTLNNSGAIRGTSAGIVVNAEYGGGATIVNSGTISGGDYGIAFAFLPTAGVEQIRDDELRILTGSQITGLVDFGQGIDLLDISQFTGTMALSTANLENIKLQDGTTQSYSTFTSQKSGNTLTAKSGNDLAVVDVEEVASTGGATAVADAATTITTEVSSIVSDQLSGLGAAATPDAGPSSVSGFAEERPSTSAEGAVLSALDVTRDNSVDAWATGFGGGSRDVTGAPLSTVFGGVVAGSHAQFDGYTVGLLGGVVGSQLATNSQTVRTTTGIIGGYGRTEIGVVRIDASLLGGYNAHSSSRNTGGAGTGTATFSSWFLAPDVGFTLPVLTNEEGELNVAFRAKYVGGAVSGYTETGSLANLTIGSQTVSLLDLRLEVNGTLELDAASRTKVFGKAGVFGQSNLGGSSVPITILGSTFDVASGNSLEYGVYSGAGVTTGIGDRTDLSASINTSARTDGLLSASAKAQLSGSF